MFVGTGEGQRDIRVYHDVKVVGIRSSEGGIAYTVQFGLKGRYCAGVMFSRVSHVDAWLWLITYSVLPVQPLKYRLGEDQALADRLPAVHLG